MTMDSVPASLRAIGMINVPGVPEPIYLSEAAIRELYPEVPHIEFDPELHKATGEGSPIFDMFGNPIPKLGSATVFHSTQLKSDMSGTVGLKAAFDGGYLQVYGGAVPATADAAETAAALAKIVLPNPLFGAFASGQLTANAVSNGSVTTGGTATYFRLTKNGDTGASSTTQQRIQGTCGVSAADMILNSVTLGAGALFTTSSIVYTFMQ